MATLGGKDIRQAVRTGSLKIHVLSSFVLIFLSHLEGLPDDKTSPPIAACTCLPASPLLPRRGMLKRQGCWASRVGLQNRTGMKLGTKKGGSCGEWRSRKQQLTFCVKWEAKSPWETWGAVVVGRQLHCAKGEGGYGSGRWTSKESNNRYQVTYFFYVMI